MTAPHSTLCNIPLCVCVCVCVCEGIASVAVLFQGGRLGVWMGVQRILTRVGVAAVDRFVCLVMGKPVSSVRLPGRS